MFSCQDSRLFDGDGWMRIVGNDGPDGVACSKANPLGHRAILLLRLCKLLLGSE